MSVRSLLFKISESSEGAQSKLKESSDKLRELREVQAELMELVGCFKTVNEKKWYDKIKNSLKYILTK